MTMRKWFEPIWFKIKNNGTITIDTTNQDGQGEWIKVHNHINLTENKTAEWDNYYCSECDTPQSAPSKFCPECSKKMKL